MTLSNGSFDIEHRAEIEKGLTERLDYTPRIAIFGKPGAGKSSTINAIFGQQVSPISAAEGYKVGTLMYEIMTRLNDHRAKISLGGSFNTLHKTLEVAQEEESTWGQILDIVMSVIPVVKTIWKGIMKFFKFW